ncbi:MAG: shikimate dehydrogenase [Proteobacteria bacterium]|nr:shikimate dehydrogenase [Pseudomonadota bacterium]
MIDALTKTYAVLGWPLAHTLSPTVHNAAFGHLGLNMVYLAFPTTDIAAALVGARALGLAGLSITIPHKEAALALVDEVEDEAAKLGAINTVINRDGRLFGANTDFPAILAALNEVTDVPGRRALVIGAGGAAKAAAFGLARAGAEVIITGRSPDRAAAMAGSLGLQATSLESALDQGPEIVINATPVGMWPGSDQTPIEVEGLPRNTVVLDMVYNPRKTRLLVEVQQRGQRIVSGLEVFLSQARLQFELWTDQPAPIEVMRAAALAALGSAETTDGRDLAQRSGTDRRHRARAGSHRA